MLRTSMPCCACAWGSYVEVDEFAADRATHFKPISLTSSSVNGSSASRPITASPSATVNRAKSSKVALTASEGEDKGEIEG